MVQRKRHLAKAISYRIVSTGIGFLAMWWVTGRVEVGVAFSAVELLWKPIQYYLHERVWYRWVRYGVEDKKISGD